MKLISASVFATLIVQTLFFLNAKFQASSHLLWLYSPVCVGPGREPLRPVFSQRGSYTFFLIWTPKFGCLLLPQGMTNIFINHLLRNRWKNKSQILYGASLRRGNNNLYKWFRSHDQDGHHLVKIFKNLLQNQNSYDLETWHAASRTQILQHIFK